MKTLDVAQYHRDADMLNKVSRWILSVSLSAFVMSALVDPGDQILHLKFPLFIVIWITWIFRTVCGAGYPSDLRIWVGTAIFAIMIPSASTLVGLLGGSQEQNQVPLVLLKSFVVLLLIPILAAEQIDLSKPIIRGSILVAALTLSMVALSIIAPQLFAFVYDFTIDKSNAGISNRDVLSLGIGSFYYKTVAVLVFPIAYYIRKLLNRPRKAISLLMIIVFAAAVLCSDSRATVLSSACICGLFVFKKIKVRFGIVPTVCLLAGLVALGGGYFAGFFHADEPSNAIKLDHARSYLEEFEAHPAYLIWGQGADTAFYSRGVGEKVTVTELSYAELVRIFGLPVAVILMLALIYPLFVLPRRGNSMSYVAIPYAAYLFEAGTNPLLLGSTGCLVVSAVWGVTLTYHKMPHVVNFARE